MRYLVILLTSLLLLPLNAFAITNFAVEVRNSSGDYTSLPNAESGLDEDITVATTKVFSFDANSGTISDGTGVSTDGGSTTGTCVHQSINNQILIKSISGGTFDDNDVVTDGSNTVTLSDSGDGAKITVTIYDNQDLSADIYFQNGTYDSDNTITYQGDTTSWDGIETGGIHVDGAAEGWGAFRIFDDYVTFKTLVLDCNSEACFNPRSSSATAINIILDTGGVRPYEGDPLLINTVSLDSPGDGFTTYGTADADYECYNCVAINATDDGFSVRDRWDNYGVIYNSVACDSTSSDFVHEGEGSLTGDYSASCDATASSYFTNNSTNLTEANEFTDADNGDVHLKSGNSIEDSGNDYSATTGINYDIDIVEVTGTWPIGADELVSAAVTNWLFVVD